MISLKIKDDAYWRKILIRTFQDQPTIQFVTQVYINLANEEQNQTRIIIAILVIFKFYYNGFKFTSPLFSAAKS